MFQSSPRLQINIIRPRNKPKSANLARVDSGEQTCKKTCRESFRQYLFNTTLHGLKYVGDNTITLFERIFFGITFLAVVLLSAYFTSNVYRKYSASPMIISLSSRSTDITSLPFPGTTVTVCNMNQAVKSVVKDIPVNSEDYSIIQSICTHAVDKNATNSKAGKWQAYQKLLIQVSQSCEEMMISCMCGGSEYNCTDIFVTVLTDEGLCCTFNGVNKRFIAKPNIKSAIIFKEYSYVSELYVSFFEPTISINTEDGRYFFNPQEFNISAFLENFANNWTPEKGFESEKLKNDRLGYPRPTAGTGTHLGLTIVLDAGISEYYCSTTNSYGFKILLHSPNEAPRITHFGTSISNGYESRVVITPTLSEASATIRKMPISVRQCLFEDENYLTYYRTYSRGNCQMECNAKIYLKICKCIQYYMPRFEDDITICGRQDDVCVEEVTKQLNEQKNVSFICDCLPGCFEVNYEAAVSMAPLLREAPLLQKKGLLEPNVSVMHIYYQNNFFRSQKKDELIGFTEFLSNTGGLLGLFMGFSVFSIVEIFYFLSIRPYSNYVKVSEKRRSINRMFRKIRKIRTRRMLTPLLSSHVEHIASSSSHSIYP